jgi:hypothetical protein
MICNTYLNYEHSIILYIFRWSEDVDWIQLDQDRDKWWVLANVWFRQRQGRGFLAWLTDH